MNENNLDQESLKKAIYAELGASDFPEATQQQILASATGPIIQSLTLAILLKLPPEAQEDFKKAFEAGDGDVVEEIITSHIPDSTSFIREEIRKATAEFRAILDKKLSS